MQEVRVGRARRSSMNADIRNETFLHEEIERERLLGLERDAYAQTE